MLHSLFLSLSHGRWRRKSASSRRESTRGRVKRSARTRSNDAHTGDGRGVLGAALKYRIVYLDHAARRPLTSRGLVEERSDCENKKSFNIMAMLMVVVMMVAIDEHVVADDDGSSGGSGRTK